VYDVDSGSAMVVVVGGEVVAGGSEWMVTVMVPMSSEDVSSGAIDEIGAGSGAGERTGPIGPAGKLVLVGSAGPLSR